MEHKFFEKHDRYELVDVDTLFRMLEMSVYESETVAKLAMYAANLHGCVLISRRGSQWHYLHRSPKYGTLQFTTWDDDGPMSDIKVEEPSDFSFLMNGTVKIIAE